MRAVLARLAALPERVARRITFVDGDARLLTLPSDARFDAELYGLDTFAHLLTASERDAALHAAHERLHAGGKLLIDLDPLGLSASPKASDATGCKASGRTSAQAEHCATRCARPL